MNVLIFGASGGIGKWAVQYALQSGHHVTAYVRNPAKITIKSEGLTIVQGEINDPKKMEEAICGQDAVIWCVGIPMKRNYPNMDSFEGHKILIRIMKEQGVKRLIDWGTPSVQSIQDKKHGLRLYRVFLRVWHFRKPKRKWFKLENCFRHPIWIGQWYVFWHLKIRSIPEMLKWDLEITKWIFAFPVKISALSWCSSSTIRVLFAQCRLSAANKLSSY